MKPILLTLLTLALGPGALGQFSSDEKSPARGDGRSLTNNAHEPQGHSSRRGASVDLPAKSQTVFSMSDVFQISTGFARPVEVHAAAVSDLDSIPAAAGWYAWFHVPTSFGEQALSLYRHSAVQAAVTGIFNLSFEGALQATGGVQLSFPENADNPECVEAMKSIYWAFAPPLYVGISTNLRGRLKTHRRQLHKAIASGASEPLNDSKMGDALVDTDQESRFFGQRIGGALRELGVSPDSLYIKCVLADAASRPFLKLIEQALNFSLTPHYGRR